MKFFGIELKFNGFDIWHKGNFDPNSKANSSHTHMKSQITDFPTSLPANGGDANTAKHLLGDDTRSINSSPSVYMSGGNRYEGRAGWQTEFKYVSTIGAGSFLNGTYCFLETKTPWSDSSGGYPIQIAYGSGRPCWRVGTSATSWSAWKGLSDEGNADTVDGKHASDFATSNHNHDAAYEPKNTNIQSHISNTTNPHGVTKSQVGLGSVSNYGIATQAEAEAGTSSSKYMTPLRVKQAIDKFKPTKLSELQNDIGAGGGIKITTSATAPTSPSPGDFWYKEV